MKNLTFNQILSLSYGLLIVVAVLFVGGVAIYSVKHVIKNKVIMNLNEICKNFVFQAEKTGGTGKEKLANVIDMTTAFLKMFGINVDPALLDQIKGIVEKIVFNMNNSTPANASADQNKKLEDAMPEIQDGDISASDYGDTSSSQAAASLSASSTVQSSNAN